MSGAEIDRRTPRAEERRPVSDAAIDRRTLLRGGAAALLGAGASGVLAACGGGTSPGPSRARVARRSIAIDYASYYPPVADLRRLVERARTTRGAAVTFSDDAAGAAAQLATLRALDRSARRLPRRSSSPRSTSRRSSRSRARRATAGRRDRLLPDAAAAARRRRSSSTPSTPAGCSQPTRRVGAAGARRSGQALLVRPPADPSVPDPFAPLAARAERALLDELARRAPGIEAVAATRAGAAPTRRPPSRARCATTPDVRVVLCWNDAAAVGAARALGERFPADDRDRLYAGGVATAGVATRAILRELGGDGVLRCLVAPRLHDLADALVALPYGLLHGRPAREARVPVRALGDAAPRPIAAYARDYASG